MAKLLCENGGAEIGRYETAEELVRLLLQGKRSEAAAFIPSLPKDRAALRRILTLGRFALRDIIADKRGGEFLFYGEKEGVPAWAKKTSVRKAVWLVGRLSEAEDSIASNLSINTVMAALFSGTNA